MINKIKKIINVFLNTKKNIGSVLIDKKIILKYLPDSAIIIDCGAHIGTDTIEFAKNEKNTIYAFEPVEEIFAQLVNNTKDFKNVNCFKLALNSNDGEQDMYISSGESDGSSSLLKPKEHLEDHPDVLFNDVRKVKCKNLDSWAKENNVAKVDMLWLDMQGAEQKMLMASKTILDTVKIIHTEVNLHETYEGIESYKSFKTFLKRSGFKIIVEAIPKGYYGGNVLFIRND